MVLGHAIHHKHTGAPKLKRTLNLFEVTAAGVGIILGAGIYVLVGKAAGLAGDSVWISFILAALIAATTGLSYAELSSLFPRASAEYTYAEHAFHKKLAFAVGWLIIIGGVFAAAAVSLGFAGYFSALFGTPAVLTALALILLLSFILYVGIKISVWLAIIFTLIETSGLLIIIGIGLPHLGSVDFMSMPFGVNGIVAAAALIFFAFIGFESIVRLSEETKEPTKNIPKALLLAIILTTIIYILVALTSVSVLGYEALAASKAPLADVAATIFGPQAFTIISIIALFATANTILLILLGTSRITYGMAEEGSLPKFLERISPKTRTPSFAILLVMLATLVFIMIEDISVVAKLTDYMVFITFIIINSAAITLRYKIPNGRRKFKIPINIGRFPLVPAIGLLLIIWLMSGLGTDVLLWGTALFIIGLLVGFVYERK